MAQVVPDSIEKSPTADVSVNKPTSGTYGEKAELNRLKAELPAGGGPGPGGPGGPTPMGAPGGVGGLPSTPGRPPGGQMPPGVPGSLGHETTRPNVPGGQKLMDQSQAGSPVRQARSSKDAQVAMLMALKDSDQVTAATREWASIVLEMIQNG